MRLVLVATMLGAATLGVAVLGSTDASAAERTASIGNMWYEEDTQRDRTRIVVDKGDTITFVVREYEPPSHTVDVDELGVSSPDLLLLDTWTTPPLDTPGTFRLYCRPHNARGHTTTLVVRAAAAAPTTPPPEARPPSPSAPTVSDPPSTAGGTAPSLTPPPTPTEPPAPAGTTQAAPTADLTASRFPVPEPWTRSLRVFAALVPIVLGTTAIAVALDGRRASGQDSRRARRKEEG